MYKYSHSQNKIHLAIYKEGDPRIRQQALKQQEFSATLNTPCIYHITDNGFVMEFIKGQNFIDFLRYYPEEAFMRFNGIINFISTNISSAIPCSSSDFINRTSKKVRTLNSYYNIQNLLAVLKKCRNNVLMGKCHGDLTLNNILVTPEHALYYIDFLPIFFESPLQDIIKIRQDTQFLWSLILTDDLKDSHSLQRSLNKLDNILYNEFMKIIQTPEYKILEILNYIRLLPYCSSTHIAKKIKEHITILEKDL